MSSALKPVLTPTGAQNPPVASQLNKPMHPQGTPTTYGQPMSHIPQNLVNIPHNVPSSTNAHNVPHHINTNSTGHSANHYSLTIPNATQHYPHSGGNISAGSHSAPVSNHPVANQAHTQPVLPYSNLPKNLTYNPNYQANPGHSYKPTNTTSSIDQNISTAQPQPVTPTEESSVEKHQSNGTPEGKSSIKPEGSQNHLSGPSTFKDKPTATLPIVSTQSQPISTPDRTKVTLLEKISPTIISTPPEQKQNVDTIVIATSPVSEKSSSPTDLTNFSKTVVPDVSSTASPTVVSSSSPVISPANQNVTVTSVTPTNLSTAAAPTTAAAVVATTTAPSVETTATADVSDIPEMQDATAAVATVAKHKEQVTQKPILKLATTPRTPVRKYKTNKLELPESLKMSKADSKSSSQKSSGSGGKSKRARTRTQPYQSPLPEVEMISKISATMPRSRNIEDKLIIFYKNEFLAVRNSEGGFYICQAVQNIYKSSPRIRIRWLSQDKNDKELYSPDFYDYTDFDCILTNLNLVRVDKGKYKLPGSERIRTDSILKRALAVEQGDATPPSLTEEHPDGLDLSLYKEESQLKKRKSVKRKASAPLRASEKTSVVKKTPDQPKVRKVVSKPKPPPVKKSTVLKRALSAKVRKVDKDSGRAERAAKRRSPEPPKITPKTSPVIDQKKAKVLAKVARKTTVYPPPKAPPVTKQSTKSAKQTAPLKKPLQTKKEKPIVTRKSKRGKK